MATRSSSRYRVAFHNLVSDVRSDRRRRRRQSQRHIPYLEGRLERRELLSPFPFTGTFSVQYHDTSVSTYDQYGYPPSHDSGTFTLSLQVVSRQSNVAPRLAWKSRTLTSNVATIGGTVSITGYPEGTISLPINSSPGFGSSETRSGNKTSIFVTAQQAGPNSIETVTFSGVVEKSRIIGDFDVHDYSDGGYSTAPGYGTSVLLAKLPGTPSKPRPTPTPTSKDPLHFNRHLTWNDYTKRSTSPPGYPYAAATTKRLNATPYGDGKWTVSVEFSKSRSWVVVKYESATLLAHEQGHFDITALAGRDLLNELQGKSVAQGQQLLNDAVAQEQLLQDLYDTTTKHGSWPAQQQLWTKELNYLKSSPTGTLVDLQQWAQQTFPSP